MGDKGNSTGSGRSLKIQHLSQFALSESHREKASKSLRKRSKAAADEEENASLEEIQSEGVFGHSSGVAVVKLRSSRTAKRSVKVGTAVQVVDPGRMVSEMQTGARDVKSKRILGQLQTEARDAEPKRISGQLRYSETVHRKEVQVAESGVGVGLNQVDYERLDASFYECDALELAPKLLGKLLRRDDVILQITEVIAFEKGEWESHIHIRLLRSGCVPVLLTGTLFLVQCFLPGRSLQTRRLSLPCSSWSNISDCSTGHAYVYLCYGLHVMLNVVADSIGVGAAVLIRACSPVAGLTSIQLRRGQVTEKPVLLTGPGKVGQALGLGTEWSSHPLYTTGGLEILNGPAPGAVVIGPRVGINYAEPKDVAALWRFAVANSPWVSAPRGTLRPQ